MEVLTHRLAVACSSREKSRSPVHTIQPISGGGLHQTYLSIRIAMSEEQPEVDDRNGVRCDCQGFYGMCSPQKGLTFEPRFCLFSIKMSRPCKKSNRGIITDRSRSASLQRFNTGIGDIQQLHGI
jgi:hypothetical protein